MSAKKVRRRGAPLEAASCWSALPLFPSSISLPNVFFVEEERVTADIQKVETKIGNIEGDIATKEKERAGFGEKTSKYKSLDRQIGALQAEKTQLHINKSKLQENKNKLLEMQSKLMDVKQSPPSPGSMSSLCFFLLAAFLFFSHIPSRDILAFQYIIVPLIYPTS